MNVNERCDIMKNIVKLNFDGTITGLAGNPYGKRIYNEQVKDKIDLSYPVVIEFPNQIEEVASSFSQGFFAELINEWGLTKVIDNVSIKSIYDYLEKNIKDDLLY